MTGKGRSGWRAVLGVLALVLACAAGGEAASYTFTKIADRSGPFSDFDFFFSMNNSGTVAFLGFLDGPAGPGSGGHGIFAGSGGPLTTIAETGEMFSQVSSPSINDMGSVAFHGVLMQAAGGGNGIFAGSGGSPARLYHSSQGFSAFGRPKINAAGTVAFRAIVEGPIDAIFRDAGGTAIKIASSEGSPFAAFDPDLAINAEGTVAFTARLDGEVGFGIFTGSGGATATVADTTGAFGGVDNPSINAGGTVAFFGGLDDGRTGIFIGGGPLSTIVDSSQFGSIGIYPSINAEGLVAFRGCPASGCGIFTGPDAVADKVIQEGDPLLGSTVTDLQFPLVALNDRGQIAFRARLADGTDGIFRADRVPLGMVEGADIAVEKIGPARATVGDTLVYTVMVTNHGPDVAGDVILNDNLIDPRAEVLSLDPARGECQQGPGGGSCQLGDLEVGESVVVLVRVMFLEPGEVTNSADASSLETRDGNLTNNTAEVTTIIVEAMPPEHSDLAVKDVKTNLVECQPTGEVCRIKLLITIANLPAREGERPHIVDIATLRVTMPRGKVEDVEADLCNVDRAAKNWIVICKLGNVSPDQQKRRAITVDLAEGAIGSGRDLVINMEVDALLDGHLENNSKEEIIELE